MRDLRDKLLSALSAALLFLAAICLWTGVGMLLAPLRYRPPTRRPMPVEAVVEMGLLLLLGTLVLFVIAIVIMPSGFGPDFRRTRLSKLRNRKLRAGPEEVS